MTVAQGGDQAGRAAGVALCLAEAAAARGRRGLEAVSDSLADADGLTRDAAADLATRVRALVGIERLVSGRLPATVEIGGLLERLATLALIAFPALRMMGTSLARREVAEPVARAVMAAVHEIMHVADAIAPNDGVELFVASEIERDQLVVAIAARGACAAPVGAGAGALAFERAGRLAEMFGGEVVEGFREGSMLMGIAMRVEDGSEF